MLKYYANKYLQIIYKRTGINNFIGLLNEGPGFIFICFSILNISLLIFFLDSELGGDDQGTFKIIFSLGLFLVYCIVYSETFKFIKSQIVYVKSDMEKLKRQMESIRELSEPIHDNDNFYKYPENLVDLVLRINQYELKKDSFYNEYEEIRKITKLQKKITQRMLTIIFIIDAYVIVYYGNSAVLGIFVLFLRQILGRVENM